MPVTTTTTDSTRAPSFRGGPAWRAQRGAILVQAAIMMVGLTAFSAFVVDYGILWTARRQIQNAADAAALAAAISLGFDAPDDQALARSNALTAVAQNPVWGAPAHVEDSDITFPACPVGSVGTGNRVCVRVQAFRNQGTDSSLPTIFGRLVNVADQGVRASATAQVLYGSSTDCVKPFAIPDRWEELRGNVGLPGWEPLDTFERYGPGGLLLSPPVDYYEPPGGFLFGPNGTGFSRGPSAVTAGDFGMSLEFDPGFVPGPAGGEHFMPAHVTPGGSFASDIASCAPRVIQPGDSLEVERNNVGGATATGVLSLIAQDAAATWTASMNNGRGGVSGGCMSTGACSVSPRIIALPAFDPDAWNATIDNDYVVVTRIVGFFIERYVAPRIVGRLMVYPAAPRSSMTAEPNSAFVVSVALVR